MSSMRVIHHEGTLWVSWKGNKQIMSLLEHMIANPKIFSDATGAIHHLYMCVKCGVEYEKGGDDKSLCDMQ